jgi:ferredoxin, 2Fe-2S
MPRLIFVTHDGCEHVVESAVGSSVMQTARHAGVAGIEGDCGGNLSCATCHVLVDEARLHQVPPIAPMEDEMLDMVSTGRQPNSRLSCQLVVSDGMDGIRIRIPDRQY